jgi:GNAT superfamily N-acetyltransferase
MAANGGEYPKADLALARRLERAEAHANARFVEARARVVPQIGACWIEVAGTYAMYDGLASPVTQTFGLGLFAEAGERELEALERFFRDRGAPVFHEVSPLAGIEVAARLADRGYRPVEFTSVMYRPAGGFADSANERIRVRAIAAEDAGLWVDTSVRGWGESAEAAAFLREIGPVCTEREDSVSFLAECDGRPIAAASLCLHGGVAIMAGACTVPEGRRQGAQRALLESRLGHAAERGCDLAMMGAQPGSASQRNAERQGFRIAYTRTKWRLG